MTDFAPNMREQVRATYAAAASAAAHGKIVPLTVTDVETCCGTTSTSCCGSTAATITRCCEDPIELDTGFGASLYSTDERSELPAAAVAASLGCGNPMMVAELREGENVLDLGSGGGIDVLLSARRVGPTGFAYGIDMTDEMLALAEANRIEAGATNVGFRKGMIEEIPLPDGAVDAVISNCVINLSTDKPAVFTEMLRVLVPGGRIGISDVVADDRLSPDDRAERGSYTGCIAGALSRSEYLGGLTAAGFTDVEMTVTHSVAPGVHSTLIRASKPSP